MRECKKLHFRREQGRKLIESQRPIVTHRYETQASANTFGQKLPRHQVTMMLHLGEEDHASFTQEFFTPRLRYQIYAFSRSAGENDFVRTSSPEVVCHPLP